MSTYSFNPKQGPIYIEAQATGPNRTIDMKLLLDTAATMSSINLAPCSISVLIPASHFGAFN